MKTLEQRISFVEPEHLQMDNYVNEESYGMDEEQDQEFSCRTCAHTYRHEVDRDLHELRDHGNMATRVTAKKRSHKKETFVLVASADERSKQNEANRFTYGLDPEMYDNMKPAKTIANLPSHSSRADVDEVELMDSEQILAAEFPEDEDLLCRVCDKELSNRHTFKNHMDRHFGRTKFKCEFCNKPCATQAQYLLHLRFHTNEKPFPCTTCDKRFASRSNLKVHERMHAGDRRHFCHICGHATVTKSNLNAHLKRHLGERNHICHVCGKGFVASDGLKSHLMIHSDIRPYACELCDSKFRSSDRLRCHVQSVHHKLKPYQCAVCEKRFTRKSNMTQHVETHYKFQNRTETIVLKDLMCSTTTATSSTKSATDATPSGNTKKKQPQ